MSNEEKRARVKAAMEKFREQDDRIKSGELEQIELTELNNEPEEIRNNYIACNLIKKSLSLDDPSNGNRYLKMGSNATTVTQDMVDNFIKDYHVSRIGNATVVRVILVNGFEIIESSVCVDAINYNSITGEKLALEKAKNQIWFLLGFLLACAKNGFSHGIISRY